MLNSSSFEFVAQTWTGERQLYPASERIYRASCNDCREASGTSHPVHPAATTLVKLRNTLRNIPELTYG